jgi:valyl-tRNA synthetase
VAVGRAAPVDRRADDFPAALSRRPATTPGDFAAAEADVEWLKSMVSALRRIRSELGVSPTRQIALLVQGGGEAECKRLGRFDSQLRFLNRIETIDVLQGEPPAAAAGLSAR